MNKDILIALFTINKGYSSYCVRMTKDNTHYYIEFIPSYDEKIVFAFSELENAYTKLYDLINDIKFDIKG